MDHRSWIMYYRLYIMDYGSQIIDHIMDHILWIMNYILYIIDYRS